MLICVYIHNILSAFIVLFYILFYLVGLAIFSERELKFMFAICHRPSVCLSVVCRLSSVVCLSVCNVRAPYSGD